ncbi:MAG: hypothetical protein ABI693_24690 [Bryobacteraceae bacterium]
MKCPVQSGGNAEILLDYCAHSLDAQRAALLEQHMVECADCQAFHDAQSALWTTMDAWPSYPEPPDFDRKIFAQIAAETHQSRWRQWRNVIETAHMQPAMPIVGACLAVLAGLLFQTTRPAAALGEPPMHAEFRVEPSDVEQAESTLEDLEMLRRLPSVAASRNTPENSL